MVQVLKPAVRARISQAALNCFAANGYADTSIAEVAAAAGIATANVYRYFSSKQALFDAVVPADLGERHDRLLDSRVTALGQHHPDMTNTAAELLDFWLDHRLAIVVLLDRAEDTHFAYYPAAFVTRLVEHAQRTLDIPLSPIDLGILEIVFDNTRRAIASILRSTPDRDRVTALISAFWSYQLPGLDGLMTFIAAPPHQTSPPPASVDN